MLICAACGTRHPTSIPRWRCDCGSYLQLEGTGLFQPESLAGRPATVWRYHEALGVDDPASRVTLGEGSTPLVAVEFAGRDVLFKLDCLSPTGSFKDRGSAVMLSKLREWRVAEIVEDSSGNAGASVAAYAARAGIAADVFVPASASAGKLAQIELYGARLSRIEGTREQTTAAASSAPRESSTRATTGAPTSSPVSRPRRTKSQSSSTGAPPTGSSLPWAAAA